MTAAEQAEERARRSAEERALGVRGESVHGSPFAQPPYRVLPPPTADMPHAADSAPALRADGAEDALVRELTDWADRLRRGTVAADDPLHAVLSSLQRLQHRPSRRVAKGGPEIVEEIWRRRDEPHIDLRIRGDVLASIYPGGIATLTGGTGAGKTSLAMEVAIRHAVESGPAIVASLELPMQIIGARVIGIRCDESWSGVLKGVVARERMLEQWPARLRVIERLDATFASIEAELEAMKAEHPAEPVLVVVDYVQIMENNEREIRRRVARSMEHIDELATRYRCGVLALSQMSRAAARAVGGSERVGADTVDAGAEAADLERWSVCTIAIGARGPAAEGDWAPVDLNLGKGRTGGGDMVQPALYCGRSGAWRLSGNARPAQEVKAERATKRTDRKVSTLVHAIPSKLDSSPEPLSRMELRAQVGERDQDVRAACATLLAAACGEPMDVVEVGKRVKGSYRLWTRRRAEMSDLPILSRQEPIQ